MKFVEYSYTVKLSSIMSSKGIYSSDTSWIRLLVTSSFPDPMTTMMMSHYHVVSKPFTWEGQKPFAFSHLAEETGIDTKTKDPPPANFIPCKCIHYLVVLDEVNLGSVLSISIFRVSTRIHHSVGSCIPFLLLSFIKKCILFDHQMFCGLFL